MLADGGAVAVSVPDTAVAVPGAATAASMPSAIAAVSFATTAQTSFPPTHTHFRPFLKKATFHYVKEFQDILFPSVSEARTA